MTIGFSRVLDEIDPTRPQLRRSEEGRVKPYLVNMIELLTKSQEFKGGIAWCEFSKRILKERGLPWGTSVGEWTERDTLELRAYIEDEWHQTIAVPTLISGIQAAAFRNPKHPVQTYLNGLCWDGADRLDDWLITYAEASDSPYSRAISRKTLIAAVARIMNPGCKADHVLVLEGEQGIGKSGIIRALAPWDSLVLDSPLDFNNKDSQLALQGCWLVELSELDSLSKGDLSRVKAFITLQEDRFRPPYGRATQSFPRQCVFIGTTNEQHYLKDQSGNRRFWPVRCSGRIDLDGIRQVRDQLWAEAVHRFRAAETWHLTQEESILALAQQANRLLVDPWETRIAEYLSGNDSVTISEILEVALGFKTINTRSRESYRVSNLLTHRFKWRKTKVTRNKLRVWGFVPPGSNGILDDDSADFDVHGFEKAAEVDESVFLLDEDDL